MTTNSRPNSPPSIELICHSGCPEADEARRHLRAALEQCGLPGDWQEWNTDVEMAPAHARTFPSPTVLVNGRDVSGASGAIVGRACRMSGAPVTELIASALREATAGPWSDDEEVPHA